jgi:hypothetical protein
MMTLKINGKADTSGRGRDNIEIVSAASGVPGIS